MPNYREDHSSDDSSWSSDSHSSKPKRRSTRKSKATTSSTSARTTAVANGNIKKPKKPGRKPMESLAELPSDPKLKRKAQNRAAQRAFRERKEQFVTELQQQIAELKAANEKREKELAKENARLKKENAKLKEENQFLKEEAKFSVNSSITDSTLAAVSTSMETSDDDSEELDMMANADEEDDDASMGEDTPIHDDLTKQEFYTPSSAQSSPKTIQEKCFGSPVDQVFEAPLTMPSPSCRSCCDYSSPYSALEESEELSTYDGSDEDSKLNMTTEVLPTTRQSVTSPLSMLPTAEITASATNSPIDAPSVFEQNSNSYGTTNPFFAATSPTDMIFANPMLQYNLPDDTAVKGLASETSDSLLLQQQQAALFGDAFVDLFDLSSRTTTFFSNNFENYDPYIAEQLEAMIQQNQQEHNSSSNNSDKSDALSDCPDEQRKPCREKIIRLLNRMKGDYQLRRSIYQINQDVKSQCPTINMDQLCEDLSRQISIDKDRVLSDREVDIYIECIARAS